MHTLLILNANKIPKLTIAELLGGIEDDSSPRSPGLAKSRRSVGSDATLQAAKSDVIRVLDILERVGSAAPDMQKTRIEVLRRAIENIRW
jgi:hypothetical protein